MDAEVVACLDNFAISTVAPVRHHPSLADDIRQGFAEKVKRLHPKYFYDEHGSELFDRICDTPEYYLTRTEFGLLRRYAKDIMQQCRPANMLEFGSGTSRKTRMLLDAWPAMDDTRTYWPFDVSQEMLEAVGGEIARIYPALMIHVLMGDYTAGLESLPTLDGRSLLLFLGSSLGNFERAEAGRFIAEIANSMQTGDYFLLGVDLVKDERILEAAYNDRQGLTAAFNKNILSVLNHRLESNFDLQRFDHRAIYNRQERRMEMYLDAVQAHHVKIAKLDLDVTFAAGEPIWTEMSCKYEEQELADLLGRSGLTAVHFYTDPDYPYALVLGRR